MNLSLKRPQHLYQGLLFLASGAALGTAGWMSLVDPALNNWGAEAQELSSVLPGDDWVKQAGACRTRAITIDASPEQVWPWLLQLGAGRGGFYTFDLIERMRTRDHSPMKRLEPGLQTLSPGDRVDLAQGLGLQVVNLLPEQALVLGSPDPEPHAWSWAFVLEPAAQGTRLLIRERYGRVESRPLRALNRVVASIDNLMTWKMLHGIKARAEAQRRSIQALRPGSQA